ncbi:MAG TPA: hypothetical protein VF893_08240 [Candidatus Bathyarchaeia archaeon]
MPQASGDELRGITLTVYLYVAKKGKPTGPRDVVKGIHLSSPSVAYRHLEKLEELGYLHKNEYGEYVSKGKPRISGYAWVGNHLMPKMFVYSFVFTCILLVEVLVLAVHYSVENDVFKILFLLLTLTTGAALAVFIAEGLLQRKRFKHSARLNSA